MRRGLNGSLRLSAADLAGDDPVHQSVGGAVELHQLQLLHREEVAGAGVDGDARQQHAEREILQVGGLLHHVGAGEIIAALLEHLNHGLGRGVAIDGVAAGLVAVREVLVHERGPLLHGRIILPGRVGGILQISAGDHALRIFQAGGAQHARHLARGIADEIDRLPAEFGGLADRLRRRLRRGPGHEDIGAGVLQPHHLGVERGIGHLVGRIRDDHVGPLAETIAQALHLVLAGVVVLPQRCDLALGIVLQDVFRVDAAFALVVGLPAHGPGKILRVAPFGGAAGHEQLRHLLGIHVFLDRRIGLGAERLEDQQHFVAFHQLARLLHGLRRAEAVVIADEGDLAAVDAAVVVDLAEIRRLGLADRAVGRGRPAERHDVADLDFGVAGAGVVCLLRRARRGGAERDGQDRGERQIRGFRRHGFSPI